MILKIAKVLLVLIVLYSINMVIEKNEEYAKKQENYFKNIQDLKRSTKLFKNKLAQVVQNNKELSEFTKKNKIDINEIGARVNKVVTELNQVKGFILKADNVTNNKIFFNVAQTRVLVRITYKNFTISDFEGSIRKQFEKIGHIADIEHLDTKQAYIYMVFIKGVNQ